MEIKYLRNFHKNKKSINKHNKTKGSPMATNTILPASTKGDTKDFLNRLKGGDDNAFGQMVKENWDKIYNRANSLLSNPQDAEEVA